MKLRAFDYVALGVCVAVVAAFSARAYTGRSGTGDISIEASGARWIYPLGVEKELSIPGPLGDTIVVIRNGKAFVQDSPCRDKTCVRMPPISRPGEWIACLPNRVFVRVQGSNGQTIDGTSY